jgi:hypothetical protein
VIQIGPWLDYSYRIERTERSVQARLHHVIRGNSLVATYASFYGGQINYTRNWTPVLRTLQTGICVQANKQYTAGVL